MTRRAWVFADKDAPTYNHLPDDLTRSGDGVECDARRRDYLLWCTRGAGHTGRHAAGDGNKVLAVWA